METKHRKGDFLINRERNWILVSGAESKFNMLSQVASELGIPNSITSMSSPGPVDEKNHFKSSKHIYWDKAKQMWDAMQPYLGNDLGIMTDVHPKTKIRGSRHYEHALVKHPVLDDGGNLHSISYKRRREYLANYLYKSFAYYESNDQVDIRQSSGVIPFYSTALIALILQKTYAHYPTNPVPSIDAAREYLDYAASHNINAAGDLDNQWLKVSAGAAGGVLHVPLLEWYVRTHPSEAVIVDTVSSNPLREMEMMGSGFTHAIVAEIQRLAAKYEQPREKLNVYLVKDVIPFFPKNSFEVIWSREDNLMVPLPLKS